jgi:hypothetical protein
VFTDSNVQEGISGLVPQWKANRRNSRGRQLPNRRLWLQLASAGKEYAKVVPCRSKKKSA